MGGGEGGAYFKFRPIGGALIRRFTVCELTPTRGTTTTTTEKVPDARRKNLNAALKATNLGAARASFDV